MSSARAIRETPTVLALGSAHGDDRAAWIVAELLQQNDGFSGKCVQAVSPWDVVPYLQSSGAVVIVDACRSGAVAGTVHRVAVHDLPDYRGIKTSTHGGSLPEALELGRTLGYDVSRVTVYAIELATADAGASLTPAVRLAVEELALEICGRHALEPPAPTCNRNGT